jgi:aminoglycoside/choline kinase family phosphotransferase
LSDFPSHPDEVTPAFLSDVLGETVETVSWEPIGTGQVGDSVRFALTYSGEGNSGASDLQNSDEARPATLAGKFPAADAASAGIAAMTGLYAKEVNFYREAATLLDVRTPKVLRAEVSEDGGHFLLLFEDLGPARGGNQIEGCTIEDARAGVAQAAAFHAPSWGNTALLDAAWLERPPEVAQKVRERYPHAQAVFAERYADSLAPDYLKLCDRLAKARNLFHPNDPPQCLVHGDFRLDNMLFDVKDGVEPIAVLDWQTATIGRAMTDIGYFLGCGIGNELRKAHEDELLALYCEEMGKRGVALSRADIWDDYRIGALHGVSTAVFSAAFVERTPRGDENFLSMARGACALALEHDSLGALEAVQ